MRRIINFANGVEVRCPYWKRDIDVIGPDGCLQALGEHCNYFAKIGVFVGVVVCTWTEKDGRREEVSENAGMVALH